MGTPNESTPERPRDASKALGDFSEALRQGKYTVDATTAKTAIAALATHSLSDKTLTAKLLSALQDGPVRRDTPAVSEGTPQPESPIWDLYINPALQKEVAELTPRERQKIDNLAQHFAEDTSSFVLSTTKPLGAPKAPLADFGIFKIKVTDELDTVREQAKSAIDPELARHLLPGGILNDNKLSLAILSHPGDPQKAILIGELWNAGLETTLFKDKRPNPQRFVCIVRRESKVLEFLRSGRDAHLFPFIYRNAAVQINKEALAYVDAPLSCHNSPAQRQWSTRKEPGDNLIILDIPNKVIINYSSLSKRDIPPEIIQTSDISKFTQETIKRMGGRREARHDFSSLDDIFAPKNQPPPYRT